MCVWHWPCASHGQKKLILGGGGSGGGESHTDDPDRAGRTPHDSWLLWDTQTSVGMRLAAQPVFAAGVPAPTRIWINTGQLQRVGQAPLPQRSRF